MHDLPACGRVRVRGFGHRRGEGYGQFRALAAAPVHDPAGLFLIGAFISTAMGTSMGTVAAIAPIAVGVGEQTDIPLALLLGVVMSGAMFGDNLSMISDTTIAATRTQGCEMKDKFRMNLLIALPAASSCWPCCGLPGLRAGGQAREVSVYPRCPYLAILVMALAGVNVFIVLLAGIVFTGAVGIASGGRLYAHPVEQGYLQRFCGHERDHGALHAGGRPRGAHALPRRYQLAVGARERAGRKLSAESPVKAGECCISLLVLLANLCTANNTVAIILTGKVAHEIAVSNGVDRRRSASLLDIFSCVVQGLIPYGAQLLLAGSIAKLSPLSIAGNNWYCMLLAVAAVFAILFGHSESPSGASPRLVQKESGKKRARFPFFWG